MRKNVIEFARIVSSTLETVEPVYEFGSLQVKGQVGFADLRPLFQSKNYVGCDMQQGPGVDMIIDLHKIELESESVGTVLCFDTLEHVEYPRKAMGELYRILKPEGMIAISSVMNFPVHGYPNDYWRYTPAGFESLLSPFKSCYVQYQGLACFPHTIAGVGQKGRSGFPEEFLRRAEKWHHSDLRSFRQWILLSTPPVFVPILTRLYNRLMRR
jgi:SAM-dependent methyltransferase